MPGSECGPGMRSSTAISMLCNTMGQTVAQRRPQVALLLATHLHRSQTASQATSHPPCWGSWRYSRSGLRASQRSERLEELRDRKTRERWQTSCSFPAELPGLAVPSPEYTVTLGSWLSTLQVCLGPAWLWSLSPSFAGWKSHYCYSVPKAWK